MKIRVLTLEDVRLDGREIPAGNVVDIDPQLVGLWQKQGLARVVKDPEPEDGAPDASPETPEESGEEPKTDSSTGNVNEQEGEPKKGEFPKHIGGGFYLLPDGTKIKGKEAALKALVDESGGDENDDAENDNSAPDGTGEPGGGESAS